MVLVLSVAAATFILPQAVFAHGIFKETLQDQVEGLRVTCNACHVKGEEKDVRNDFGELFFAEFEGEEFSKNWKELEEDEEARDKYEQEVMAPAFIAALETIGETENEDGEKYADLIADGKIAGTKLRKKK